MIEEARALARFRRARRRAFLPFLRFRLIKSFASSLVVAVLGHLARSHAEPSPSSTQRVYLQYMHAGSAAVLPREGTLPYVSGLRRRPPPPLPYAIQPEHLSHPSSPRGRSNAAYVHMSALMTGPSRLVGELEWA